MSKQFDGMTFYKGRMGIAPIWVADIYGDCQIRARWGFIGEILLDIASGMAQLIMRLDDSAQGFPIIITDKDWSGQ